MHENNGSPLLHGDAFEAWLTQGVELGVEPTTPMATTIAVMSTSNLVGLNVSTSAERAAVPRAPLANQGNAPILVLRV